MTHTEPKHHKIDDRAQ